MVPKPPRLFVQRATPATRHFPNLRRIQPGLQARKGAIPKDPNDADRRRSLRSMYHDMGVLAYSGVSTEKVNKIGDLLKDAINPGLWLTTAPGGDTDTPFDKFTVYRLQTEEWHIDQSFKPKRGSIKIEGMLDLALKAVRQWTGHIMEKAEGIESLKDSFALIEASARINDDFANRGGVLHHTANGIRRLPVEAYVLASGGNRFSLQVNLVTVGTRKFLGTVHIRILPLRTKNGLIGGGSKWETQVGDIFNLAPNDYSPNLELLRETTDNFYKLEREVWHNIYKKEAEAKAREQVTAKAKADEEAKAKIEEEVRARVEGEAESQSKKPEEIDTQPEQDSAEPSTKS
ncbi:hypothetical protein NCS52_01290700 [Fusarium sp. LHS14.1]|nr:hypothetical protein NCS52_01290700 [Fusarium sp. LHS14.1]